nr:hypothetical protein [Tanacetum cinerariifolium]
MFDRSFRRVNTFKDFKTELVKGKEKRAREEMILDSIKKQKVDDDKEKAKLKQLMETIPYEEEVAIYDILLAVKSSWIVDWKIHKEGKKSNYQIVRADGNYQMYMIFSQMLKIFNKEYLEDLYNIEFDRDDEMFATAGVLRHIKVFNFSLSVMEYEEHENVHLLIIHEGIPTGSDEFPLPEQLPTANEDKFPLLIQSDATANELCVAAKVKE